MDWTQCVINTNRKKKNIKVGEGRKVGVNLEGIRGKTGGEYNQNTLHEILKELLKYLHFIRTTYMEYSIIKFPLCLNIIFCPL